MPRRNFKKLRDDFDNGRGVPVPASVSFATWLQLSRHIERAFLMRTGWRVTLRDATRVVCAEMRASGMSAGETAAELHRSVTDHQACGNHDRVGLASGVRHSDFIADLMVKWAS